MTCTVFVNEINYDAKLCTDHCKLWAILKLR